MALSGLLGLLGGVALFLFGMSLMGDGLKKVAGSKLEVLLYQLSGTPLRGLLLGTGVTAVIQSSSATSVMVVGFVNSGMMKVNQAIGIILGAIIGTSVTGWILSLSELSGSGWLSLLSTETLTSVIAVIGIVLRMFSKKQSTRHLADILLGFAVLMYGMHAMSDAVKPLRDSPLFLDFITTFSNPLFGILIGIVFTAVIQSASAAVGILQALAATGAIDFAIAFPMIMGICIGASVPVLLTAIGSSTAAKRTALTYLIIGVAGAVVVGGIFYGINAATPFAILSQTMTATTIALLNTIYRVAVVLPLALAIPLLDKLVTAIIPDRPEDEEMTADMDRLEDRFLQHPALAVEQCRLTISEMARKAKTNLEVAFSLLRQYTNDGFQKAEALESVIDRYEDKIGTYLMKLTGRELAPKLSRQVSKYLHTVGDFERLSDHALNIAENAQEIHEKNINFSDEGRTELDVLTAAVEDVLDLAVRAFIDDDFALARRVEPLEDHIDDLCDEMKIHHVERLQDGRCTLNQGFVFNDLLTNFERVADHCSNIAVAVLELESDNFNTHAYLKNIKEMHTGQYEALAEEYAEKYRFPGDE
ncbi:MAG: Na/Pi cotransporter family protein [Oscillospiraceae bacterium]|nr:Na/Pi cotransporter family protein [Oscillospiraceae bacterium]